MLRFIRSDVSIPVLLLLGFSLLSSGSLLAIPATLRGKVVDPVGAVVTGASVSLMQGEKSVAATHTKSDGSFEFEVKGAGRYSVHVEASGFEAQDSKPIFVAANGTETLVIALRIGPLPQQIVVSATGLETPQSQVGASVSVIDQSQLEDLNKTDVLETMRTLPGVQVVQTGQRGGTTSLSVRGGEMDFNKVLVDGIPVNDIGGSVEFANISTTGVDRIEILRGSNSVLYGTDALGSVINISTSKGSTTTPEITYIGSAGNFGTYQNDVSIAGAFRRFDYFSQFARFDTQNSVPNSSFYNGTYAGNFGVALDDSTEIRFTVRHTNVGLGDPNALNFYGIPDDSSQKEQDTYWGMTLQNQSSPRWHNLVRFVSTQLNFQFVNPSPTGTPFEGNFLGDTVTIRGANGYNVTGQAILDFGGTYPQTFTSQTVRRSVYAQSDYEFLPNLEATAGFRYEHEDGFADSPGAVRNNYSYFLEGHGSLWHRLFATAGVGLEDNAVFGFAATPRISAAYYLRRPASEFFLGDTKLTFNFGKGIKEPSIFDSGSSLYSVLSQLPGGPGLISQFGISPIGPERSTSFDFGLTQALWHRRARLGIDFFHNNFSNLIEFLSSSTLPLLGFPASVVDAVAASGPGGATVNSSSYRALGAEAQIDVDLGQGWRAGGSYTYLDPVVTRAFSTTPVFNPLFPGVPIGVGSALVGRRPFRMAPHSGNFYVGYERRKFGAQLNGYLVTRQDDSTFLTDAFGGTSMLLPNHDLNPGYQLVDLSARYSVNSTMTFFTSIGNLLSEHYTAAFGYPALPFTIRSGIKIIIGGEGWRPR